MTHFHFFQIPLTPETRARMQANPDIDQAVRKIVFGAIDDAMNHSLYQHAAVIEAGDETSALMLAQDIEPGESPAGILYQSDLARAARVGDIVINNDTRDAWLVASSHWEALSWDRASGLVIEAMHREDAIFGRKPVEDFVDPVFAY